MSEAKAKEVREAGVYVIIYKNQDGTLGMVERATKREASRTLEGLAFESIVKAYRGAKPLSLKLIQKIEF
jgi:hypothetical protein